MAERQKIIETNRSIRTIKNELESLLEKDMINYASYEQIHALLPAEASLNGSLSTPQAQPPPPAAARVASPPTYAQTTSAQPPALPTRNPSSSVASPGPPAPPPPSKPVISHAKALYRYAATDARDLALERDDHVLVYEYMNADWWMGRNERTLAEGIFPKTYVEPTADPNSSYNNHNHNGYMNEKSNGYAPYAAPQQAQYGGYPPAPQQQNPYNSAAPPMAIAEQPQEGGAASGGKAGEMGKKFGKKLGNAAIFGAGASIGSNIVNSIF
ncbi:SH3 domain-containing protein [Coniella lustricola]|uniref:SH3 domain-containing protein n=1 Tax=Coniella lustricola TaxID=2025994 RepID=A0A2T2ZSC5_9PEZI|nr:SH3 domain-containing protein [Coniella lustricola]